MYLYSKAHFHWQRCYCKKKYDQITLHYQSYVVLKKINYSLQKRKCNLTQQIRLIPNISILIALSQSVNFSHKSPISESNCHCQDSYYKNKPDQCMFH